MKADEILSDGRDQLISNGVLVRTGTVAAFLVNARVWCESKAGSTERAVAETDIVEALPALHTMGLFDVLAVRDEALEQMIKRQRGT